MGPNKIYINSPKIGERESQETDPSRIEIFTRFLKNGLNTADTNGVETKILMERCHGVSGTMGPRWGPPT